MHNDKNTRDTRADAFIARWQGVAASELATAQSFIIDLCELLDVPKPHATTAQDYMFERPITFAHGDGSSSAGRIDCYRRGHFVLEAKKLKAGTQSRRFDDGLLRARTQAENYARALPAAEGRPPFVLVVDVGTVIELYAEFSRSGGTYTPFPDPAHYRIALADLALPQVRAQLHLVWTAPEQLDPARIRAQVTRTVSGQLAQLAKALEQDGHAPAQVAAYLSRCLFSMFAEDVELLPPGAFLGLLQRHRDQPDTLQQMLHLLWADMDTGGFCGALAQKVVKFNGKLFKGADAPGYSLPLTPAQIDLLLAAAQTNWREVEPAIFGTLLERALSTTERHALGAHYTPRAYVERLIMPTVMEPLRAEWANAQAAALLLAQEATELEANPPPVASKEDFAALDRHQAQVRAKWEAARNEVRRFHHHLCTRRVLDPACGSANFLYVTLEHLKRLEGEVLNQLRALGKWQDALDMEQQTVTLQQLRGIELNPRAAALAELVLWIGYLQWQVRTFGRQGVAEPVVHDYGNIECRDAVLHWSERTPALDANGVPITRWDGITVKPHPATGEPVPDDTARVPVWHYQHARPADWPPADFIVGNPPFIGASTMRAALGDGYVQALRQAWPHVPDSADFVMFWWAKAAELVARGQVQRMGLITTNSLRQTFNRRVVQAALDKHTALTFAIADHPWVDSANGAAVRIAMTVLQPGPTEGRLCHVTAETPGDDGEVAVTLHEHTGHIHADLSVGANVAAARTLQAMTGISSPGVKLHGAGFIVTPAEADTLLAATPAETSAQARARIIRDYRNGRDLTDRPRGVRVIDAFGLSADELRAQHPGVYQWLLERIKPERDAKASSKDGAGYAKLWWLHGKPRQEMRKQLHGLPRYIATVETAKHRVFQFVDADILPDNMVIAIALDDGLSLGVLSSQLHQTWALATGGTLEDRPRYNKSRCFETFPFPSDDTGLTPELAQRIAQLAEHIDTHRKRQQAAHASVTLTGLYNVLEALRAGRALTPKEKTLHQQGLVGVLLSLHQELDAAVLQAYGWADLTPALASAPGSTAHTHAVATLLQRLVELNARRATEEAQGTVRWLRPAFQQAPQPGQQTSIALPAPDDGIDTASGKMGRHGTAGTGAAGGKGRKSSKTSTHPGSATGTAIVTQPWPGTLAEQIKAVAHVLAQADTALTLADIAAHFTGRGRWRERLPALLNTLEALGRIHAPRPGVWVQVGGR